MDKSDLKVNPLWKNYSNNSQLVLVFGYVSARVDVLKRDDEGKETHFGITTHPYMVYELIDSPEIPVTREDAQRLAEGLLVGVILPAAELLKASVPDAAVQNALIARGIQ